MRENVFGEGLRRSRVDDEVMRTNRDVERLWKTYRCQKKKGAKKEEKTVGGNNNNNIITLYIIEYVNFSRDKNVFAGNSANKNNNTYVMLRLFGEIKGPDGNNAMYPWRC